MAKKHLLRELLGMPNYLFDYHELLLSDQAGSPFADENLEEQIKEEFYKDDRHITGAVVQLHPLLYGTEACSALVSALVQAQIREVTSFFEIDRHAPEPHVVLVVGGAMRLVAYTEGQRPVEIGQCRAGQWLGLPSALREFDEVDPEKHWTRPINTRIRAIPFGPVFGYSLPLVQFVALMHAHMELVRYVRQHVAVRFGRREEIIQRMQESAIIRLLPPADQEYLMQLGVVRRLPKQHNQPNESVQYLSAGKPSRRVALVMAGKCTAFTPLTENDNDERYVGKFGVADLFGHEALIMPEERELLEDDDEPGDGSELDDILLEDEVIESLPDGAPAPVEPSLPSYEIQEAPRLTNIYALPGAEVLEFFWYGFRWTLDDRMSTWKRIVERVLTAHHPGNVPEIISMQASRPKLGTSTLAQSLAVYLADKVRGHVCIMDLDGEHRYKTYFEPRGFTKKLINKKLQATVRAQRSGGSGQTIVSFYRLIPPVDQKSEFYWPNHVHVIWPKNPENVNETTDLVEILLNEADLHYVILCSRRNTEILDDASKNVAMNLNSRCSTVLYLTDAVENGYDFSDVEPPRLVWVERMTPEYMQREQDRMVKAMNEARFGNYLPLLPPPVREPITSALGGLPDSKANLDFVHRRQIVRVPDDPEGSAISDSYGPHSLVGSGAQDTRFKRAVARLGRVVMRQTVGLALGGGGAWGYSHLALIQNLIENEVPIDYITGTSFGSMVGGLFVAGGVDALEVMLDENSLSSNSILSPVIAALTTPLMKTVMFASISASTIEWFINGQLRRMNVNDGKPIGLGTTEVPFYPISSNLSTFKERTEEHGTVGHGVRLSGTMPPVAPAFRLNDELLVDGAFVANVPSRYLREIGADFVIAANAVPPAPSESPKGGIIKRTIGFFMRRMSDALAANQLLTWKAGEDQGQLHADYVCDLRPKNANVFDMWKGRSIMEQVRRDHFSGARTTAIRKAYDAFCANPNLRREYAEEPDAGDGRIYTTKG